MNKLSIIFFSAISLVSLLGIAANRSQDFRLIQPIDAATHVPNGSSQDERELRMTMRELWKDQIVWTRLYLLDYANNTGFADADEDRLHKNQKDIGNVLKPYLGEDKSTEITNLLKVYNQGIMELISVLKSKDDKKIQQSLANWNNNTNQLADTLVSINPNWIKEDLRAKLATQVELTKTQAINIIDKESVASIKDFDKLNTEVLQLSDMLTDGIIMAYPSKF